MREDFNYFFPLRVRYSEIDGQRVVFNGVYLTYFDVAFTEYLRRLGINYAESSFIDWDTAVAKATIEYHSPAYFDEVLLIYVRVSRIGSKSFDVDFEAYKEGTDALVVTGKTTYVTYDIQTRETIEIPSDVRSLFTEFERRR